MKIELSCGNCGGNRFIYPFELSDEAVITCADCAYEVGTVAALQQKVVEELENRKTGA